MWYGVCHAIPTGKAKPEEEKKNGLGNHGNLTHVCIRVTELLRRKTEIFKDKKPHSPLQGLKVDLTASGINDMLYFSKISHPYLWSNMPTWPKFCENLSRRPMIAFRMIQHTQEKDLKQVGICTVRFKTNRRWLFTWKAPFFLTGYNSSQFCFLSQVWLWYSSIRCRRQSIPATGRISHHAFKTSPRCSNRYGTVVVPWLALF